MTHIYLICDLTMIMKWWQKRFFLVGLLYTLCYCRGTREQYTRRDGGCCCPAGSWWPLHGPLRLTPVPHHSTTCHYSQMEIKDNKPHHHSPAAPSYVSYLYTSSFFYFGVMTFCRIKKPDGSRSDRRVNRWDTTKGRQSRFQASDAPQSGL